MVMTEQEHQLFLEVPPPHYVRQVTVELSRNYHAHGTRTVEDLIRRFDEVRDRLDDPPLLPGRC